MPDAVGAVNAARYMAVETNQAGARQASSIADASSADKVTISEQARRLSYEGQNITTNGSSAAGAQNQLESFMRIFRL